MQIRTISVSQEEALVASSHSVRIISRDANAVQPSDLAGSEEPAHVCTVPSERSAAHTCMQISDAGATPITNLKLTLRGANSTNRGLTGLLGYEATSAIELTVLWGSQRFAATKTTTEPSDLSFKCRICTLFRIGSSKRAAVWVQFRLYRGHCAAKTEWARVNSCAHYGLLPTISIYVGVARPLPECDYLFSDNRDVH